jgi:hypothetical protein
MADGNWLDMKLPIEKELTLTTHRRAAAHMHPHELVAIHDSLLVSYCHCSFMLEQAMKRVAELELREAVNVQNHHLDWAREVLGELGENAPQP